jgi:hypothetical protein
MLVTINHISESKTHAILATEIQFGKITQVVSGWAKLDCTEPGLELKSTFDVPAKTVTVDKRVDRKTGETWEWLVFA